MIHRMALSVTTITILFLAGLLLLSGCSFFAKSPVGQAIQAADFEGKVIVAAARQVKGMCNANPPQLTPTTCVDAQAAYTKWRAAQITAANAIASWKAVSTAGAASPELSAADARVKAALAELDPLAQAAMNLYKQFVDVKKIEQQVAPVVAPAPTTQLPMWLALEGSR
jgi:hypothetical protein